MQHFSTSQQNPFTAWNLDSFLVPDRPAPAPKWPAQYLAPARPVPVRVAAPAAALETGAEALDDDVVVDLRAVAELEATVAVWRTVHVVDVENLLDGAHVGVTAEQVRACLDDYRHAVGAGPDDVFYLGANPGLWFTVHEAADGQRVVGYTGKDGADRALLEVVDGDLVVERFDRICIASGDHAFAPLARTCKDGGLVVTVAAPPMAVSAELYRAATEHVVLGQGLAAA